MTDILNRFKKSNEKEGFFVFYRPQEEPEAETLPENSAKTVFEQVAIRQRQSQKSFKYKYALLLSIGCAAIFLLSLLGHYLSVYRRNAPTTLCDALISAYEENDSAPFLEYCTNLPKVLKDGDKLQEYFKEFLPDDEFSYYGVASGNSREQKFIFKSGNTKIAEIVFRQSSQSDTYGIKSYYVKSFDLEPLTTYRISAYSTLNIRINSEPIDEKYLYSRTKVAVSFEDFSETVVTQDLYLIDDFNYISEIVAYDYDGTLCDISYNSETSQYDITRSSDDIKATAIEFCQNFTGEYLNYTLVEDKDYEPVLSYIHPNSYLYKGLKEFSIESGTEYSDGKIENFVLKDIECFGNGYYSCEISADFVAENDEETTAVSFNKTLYLVKEVEKLYVIDIS